MPTPDNLPIHQTAPDTSRLSPERLKLLWADVDRHVAASHLFEGLGETKVAAKHLQAVTRLLVEIHS